MKWAWFVLDTPTNTSPHMVTQSRPRGRDRPHGQHTVIPTAPATPGGLITALLVANTLLVLILHYLKRWRYRLQLRYQPLNEQFNPAEDVLTYEQLLECPLNHFYQNSQAWRSYPRENYWVGNIPMSRHSFDIYLPRMPLIHPFSMQGNQRYLMGVQFPPEVIPRLPEQVYREVKKADSIQVFFSIGELQSDNSATARSTPQCFRPQHWVHAGAMERDYVSAITTQAESAGYLISGQSRLVRWQDNLTIATNLVGEEEPNPASCSVDNFPITLPQDTKIVAIWTYLIVRLQSLDAHHPDMPGPLVAAVSLHWLLASEPFNRLATSVFGYKLPETSYPTTFVSFMSLMENDYIRNVRNLDRCDNRVAWSNAFRPLQSLCRGGEKWRVRPTEEIRHLRTEFAN